MSLDLSPHLAAIESEMAEVVTAPDALHAPLYDMMRYHLGWVDAQGNPAQKPRGKRLRPLLCLLACQAVGGMWRRVLPAAAAIELIHNFSLIHDDIEDDSHTRHHQVTVWKRWGIAQGINTGDAMWALSRWCIYRLMDRSYGADQVLDVARRLDETCLALCHGQYLDISFEGQRDISAEAYERMVAGKSAALIAASLSVGALLGGAEASQINAMQRLGHELGIAFQFTDDLLGIWGDPEVTGKSAAGDLLNRKMTLPVIHALAWERERGESVISDLYAQKDLAPHALPKILERLSAAGSQEYVRQRAYRCQQEVLSTLDELALSNGAGDALRELTLGIVDRRY